MSRFFRVLVAFLAIFVSLGVSARPALAAPPAAEPTPELAPRDVPMAALGAAEPLPLLPAHYRTSDLGWLVLSYPPAAEERVEPLVRDAEAFRAELATAFEQPVLAHVDVRIAPTTADMARLAPPNVGVPEYASGVAYPSYKLVLLSMLAPRGAEAVDLEEVFRHELVHIALGDATLGRHVPRWFNEGLAIGLSGEHAVKRAEILSRATLSGTLLPFSELDKGFPNDDFEVNIAYAESADFVRFLARRADQLRFASMVSRVREGEPFDRALADAYGSDLRKLEFQWRGDVERRYSIIPILTGGGLIWVLVIGGLGYAYVKRRRRTKAILAKWAREEALEDALRARAAAVASSDTPLLLGTRPSASIKIEHEGDLHTLH
jgi:Peptidase MA superfamily